MKIIFSREQEQEILSWYQSDERPDAATIGIKYGVSSFPIYCLLHRHGIVHKGGAKPISPIIDGKKQCRGCGQWKFVATDFSKDNHSYRMECKKCRVEILRERNLRTCFGITGEEYDRLLQLQGRVCAICKKPDTAKYRKGKTGRRLAVDHDHETGKVRGLLCGWCNRAIGFLGEDLDRAKSAIIYLKQWKES